MKKKQMIGTILGAILFVACFVILAHNIGTALEEGMSLVDENGGVRSVAKRIWTGKDSE